jgi:tRNA-dihydrouridine synthase
MDGYYLCHCIPSISLGIAVSFLNELPKPFFVLAPMDGVTDTVFRRIVIDCARPDIVFTEFVNVDGLQSPGRESLTRRIEFKDGEKPIIAQIWGKNPDNYYKTAKELVQAGFAGIDINMGCPDKTIVKNGCCSALINNQSLALEIIKATQEGSEGSIPVSVKTRLGFNVVDLSWPDLLLHQNLSMLTIHGRTRKEMSSVPASWDAIGEVRKMRDKLGISTLVVGNGDVVSRKQGLELAEEYALDGIMIGRGVLHDPFVFAIDSPWSSYTKQQRIALYTKHVKLYDKIWPDAARQHVAMLNKFCKIYINDFEGAKELREQFMKIKDTKELLDLLSTIG